MRFAHAALVVLGTIAGSSALAADWLTFDDVNSTTAGPGGVTFNYGGGEGQPSHDVTIAGTAGSDCLRMYMYIGALKRAPGGADEFGLSFSIDLTKKVCSMQLRPIGA
jgi:hypothetical protein